MSFLARYRTVVVGFITLILPMVLLWFHGRPRQEPTIYEKTLLRFTTPAQSLMESVLGGAKAVWTDYTWLVAVQKENHQLRKQNETLAGMVQDRELLKKENQRLKSLLKFKGDRPDLVTIAARVVANDISPFHRVLKIVISAGEGHGIRRYHPVVTPAGVVGHIERTVGDYAEVKLAVDAGSRISVTVAERKLKGVVVGSGNKNNYIAALEIDDPKRQIRSGDMLVTNGEGQRFPKGLVVGYVADEPSVQRDATMRFVITPSLDFATLDEVLVVTSQLEELPPFGGDGAIR